MFYIMFLMTRNDTSQRVVVIISVATEDSDGKP